MIAKRIGNVMARTGIYVAVFLLSSGSHAYPAQDNANDKGKKDGEVVITSNLKQVSGEVSFVSPQYITVIYAQNPEQGTIDEIMVYVDPKARIEHKKNLSDIQVGDVVSIDYEERIETTRDKESQKRTANVIRYIRSKPTGLVSY